MSLYSWSVRNYDCEDVVRVLLLLFTVTPLIPILLFGNNLILAHFVAVLRDVWRRSPRQASDLRRGHLWKTSPSETLRPRREAEKEEEMFRIPVSLYLGTARLEQG